MKNKLLVATVSLFLVSGIAGAVVGANPGQGDMQITEAPHQVQDNQPETPGDQSNTPGERQGGPAENLPDLPQQASDTAKQVIDTIRGITDPAGGAIGQALQGLFGGGPNLNETGQGDSDDDTQAA